MSTALAWQLIGKDSGRIQTYQSTTRTPFSLFAVNACRFHLVTPQLVLRKRKTPACFDTVFTR